MKPNTVSSLCDEAASCVTGPTAEGSGVRVASRRRNRSVKVGACSVGRWVASRRGRRLLVCLWKGGVKIPTCVIPASSDDGQRGRSSISFSPVARWENRAVASTCPETTQAGSSHPAPRADATILGPERILMREDDRVPSPHPGGNTRIPIAVGTFDPALVRCMDEGSVWIVCIETMYKPPTLGYRSHPVSRRYSLYRVPSPLQPSVVTDTHDPLHPSSVRTSRRRMLISRTVQVRCYLGLGTIAVGQQLLLVVQQFLASLGGKFLVLCCREGPSVAVRKSG